MMYSKSELSGGHEVATVYLHLSIREKTSIFTLMTVINPLVITVVRI